MLVYRWMGPKCYSARMGCLGVIVQQVSRRCFATSLDIHMLMSPVPYLVRRNSALAIHIFALLTVVAAASDFCMSLNAEDTTGACRKLSALFAYGLV